MNNRHIQTFLMVSAAFFAMSAPLRSNAASPSAASRETAARSTQIASRSGCQESPRAGTSRDDEAKRS